MEIGVEYIEVKYYFQETGIGNISKIKGYHIQSKEIIIIIRFLHEHSSGTSTRLPCKLPYYRWQI